MNNLTTKDILKLIRIKILEQTDEVVLGTTIISYLNLTYQDIQIKSQDKSRIATSSISIVLNEGTLPTDFGTQLGKPKNQNGEIVSILGLQDFRRSLKTDLVCTIMNGKVLVKEDSKISSLVIDYYKSYLPLSVSQDPETNAYFDECLIYGAVYRAMEDIQDHELSIYFKNIYDNMLVEKMAMLSAYQEQSQESTMFNGITII
jgi:hypothetical protein